MATSAPSSGTRISRTKLKTKIATFKLPEERERERNISKEERA